MNLVSQANIDIFLHDTSNILNNIQGMENEDSNTIDELINISYFYKDLLDKFKNINPPKEFEKTNEFLISSMESCIKNLEKILFSKDKLNIKENTISFMESNEYLIKSLQQINLNHSK